MILNNMSQLPRTVRVVLFLLFFLSGFCGLVYQVVWTRMAFASFGIITPVLSVVISVFMLGLSAGAWAGGRWVGALVEKSGLSAAYFYGLVELIIGFGAFAVPKLFALGHHLLLASGESNSLGYLALSALVLAVSILPWCVCMGATFPFMMAYVRQRDTQSTASFSYLYLANVLGAMLGTLVTALVLVELFGFRNTLLIAASMNWLIALISLRLGWGAGKVASQKPEAEQQSGFAIALSEAGRGRLVKWILFTTGFAAMAMEVVWTRAFAPVLKTQVYSFALVVATYLGATFVGSLLYRDHLRKKAPRPTVELIALLCASAFLPILANDCRFVQVRWWQSTPDSMSAMILLLSICPFCGILGYLTPGLVDEYAAGSPERAGTAYAINVVGCILGPLVASYLLLPQISERYALILLGLPFLGFLSWMGKELPRKQQLGFAALACSVLAVSILFSRSFEDYAQKYGKNAVVRRDYAASVISFGDQEVKHLLVNGMGMTVLTPVTKFMAHLPLAHHKERPESALIICFGMGTSFRSALSWDIETTAVELVPSVTDAFGFYHADADRICTNSKGHIVIDDGRRYLERTRGSYDVIVVDPPPPIAAAGSSLLYSREFYEAAKQRLKPDGILQAWIPGTASKVGCAALRSLCEAFPYVRSFPSVQAYGMHMLASRQPIERRSASELAARMPPGAQRDLLEWSSKPDAALYLNGVVSKEMPLGNFLELDPKIRITDDQPYNEYFLLRRLGVLDSVEPRAMGKSTLTRAKRD